MAQYMIDITADDATKTKDYGRPIALNKFSDLNALPDQPAAAAAKLDALE
jgi:hypothetical protein